MGAFCETPATCHVRSDILASPGFIVERHAKHLRAHPDFSKHIPSCSDSELSVLADRGESAFDDPVVITQNDYVIEGHALWQLATLQNRPMIGCLVREMSREEALIHIIRRHRGSRGISPYLRILLALEVEPWFKARAKLNQRVGGKDKGSSQLTEADRVDVREEVARTADVSAGNVSKVKHILANAIPDVQEAARLGRISISRAFEWAKASPDLQEIHLRNDWNRRGIDRTIDRLLKKHQPTKPKLCSGLRDIRRGLEVLHRDKLLIGLKNPLRAMLSDLHSTIRAIEDSLHDS